MKNSKLVNSVRIALAAFVLIHEEGSAAPLPIANYTGAQNCSAPTFGPNLVNMKNVNSSITPSTADKYISQGLGYFVDWDNKHRIEGIHNLINTKNYYPASEHNKEFGAYTLQEIGNGNGRFTAIDGEVSVCPAGDPKTAIKQYGDGVYDYSESYTNCISLYRLTHMAVHPDETLPDEVVHDLEALDEPIVENMIYAPSATCKHNIDVLKNYLTDMKKDARELQEKASTILTTLKGARLNHKANYIREFCTRATHKLLAIEYYPPHVETSNEHIRRNVGNIFPSTSKVAEATKSEVNSGECVHGSFQKYIDQDGQKHPLCIGNSVDGPYIGDYLLSHPETKDWAPCTSIEIMKHHMNTLYSNTMAFVGTTVKYTLIGASIFALSLGAVLLDERDRVRRLYATY